MKESISNSLKFSPFELTNSSKYKIALSRLRDRNFLLLDHLFKISKDRAHKLLDDKQIVEYFSLAIFLFLSKIIFDLYNETIEYFFEFYLWGSQKMCLLILVKVEKWFWNWELVVAARRCQKNLEFRSMRKFQKLILNFSKSLRNDISKFFHL